MGRLCGERETAQALRAPAGRKKRVSPHPAPKNLKPPRSATRPRASRSQPAPARSQPPTPHLRRPFRAYILGYTHLSPTGSDAPPRASAPAAAGAPPRQPHPAAASRPPPAPHLRRHLRRPFRAYILGYASLSPTGSDAPPRASAPAAAGASRPLALRRGQEGSAPSPAGKAHPAPTFSAAPTSAQPPFSSRSRSPWHTAPRRWYGCHGRDTAAGRARFGRGRIRSG